MRTQVFTTALCSLAAAAAAALQTTTVTLHIPPTQALPNPRALPPSTHATLTSFGADAAAYLTPLNTFVFRNVSEGSYLLDVHSLTHAFAPLRVDVVSVPSSGDKSGNGDAARTLKVSAWETYRGNDWNNKGEAVSTTGGSLEVRVLGGKAFYMERSSCGSFSSSPPGSWDMYLPANKRSLESVNILNILKNPMILLGLVSMGIFVGMPYLVDNSKSPVSPLNIIPIPSPPPARRKKPLS